MAGLRRYFLSDSPLRSRLEEIFRTLPQRTVSLVGQAPLGGSQVAEWDFESPDSWRWHTGIIADDLNLGADERQRIIAVLDPYGEKQVMTGIAFDRGFG